MHVLPPRPLDHPLHGGASRQNTPERPFHELGAPDGHEHSCYLRAVWLDHAADDKNVRWTREFYAAMAPYLEGGVYVNDFGDDEPDRVRAAYGANYERLVAIKAKYDPGNFFRGNQNVPAAA
jgi:hypothetical protein